MEEIICDVTQYTDKIWIIKNIESGIYLVNKDEEMLKSALSSYNDFNLKFNDIPNSKKIDSLSAIRLDHPAYDNRKYTIRGGRLFPTAFPDACSQEDLHLRADSEE